MNTELQALAQLCGIADEYHDIWGGLHATSDSTRRDLLLAMHLPPAGVNDNPAGLLQELQQADEQRPLPPVLVVRIGEAIRIPQRLATWQWTLILETGETRSGTCQENGNLELQPVDTPGYHRVEFRHGKKKQVLALIVVPHACHQPAAMSADSPNGGRVWGLTTQLYGVRSRRNWGIGDFTDLARLIEFTAQAGGAVVGVNPLHALFPHNPAHISPYSPSQRGFIDVLYLDVEAVPGFVESATAQRRLASADFQARLQALRDAPCVDYPGVAAAKFEILALLFAELGDQQANAFKIWRKDQGESLERHALFEALQEHFHAADAHVWGWPVWPAAYHNPDAPEVAAFAKTHAERVTWFAWLQWLADSQLASAAERARQLGLAVGIYQDLAIGANPGGAEIWRWQSVFAMGEHGAAHAGAPPDEINSMGQDWGLPPFVPHRLREAAYGPFIEILRANMRHAGALRIDHVMGLARMFWVPEDVLASEGAYVHYDFEDMLGIVALESQRNQCLVIGEDLGTVPEGFRERMAAAGVLSYHPMIFERYEDGQFRLPADIPAQALVAISTHDLPTVRGFWRGIDLDARAELHLFPTAELQQRMLTERNWDRGRLLWALEREGLLPVGAHKDPVAMPEITADIVAAVHAFLSRAPSQLMVVQAEDLLDVLEQPNLPGTLEDQHPNWQRKLPLPLEDWPTQARVAAILAAVSSERMARPA